MPNGQMGFLLLAVLPLTVEPALDQGSGSHSATVEQWDLGKHRSELRFVQRGIGFGQWVSKGGPQTSGITRERIRNSESQVSLHTVDQELPQRRQGAG